jgi:hypothetical protein
MFSYFVTHLFLVTLLAHKYVTVNTQYEGERLFLKENRLKTYYCNSEADKKKVEVLIHGYVAVLCWVKFEKRKKKPRGTRCFAVLCFSWLLGICAACVNNINGLLNVCLRMRASERVTSTKK